MLNNNLMNIIKVHFFEKVVCNVVDSSTFGGIIDVFKLNDGITALFDAFSQYNNNNKQQLCLRMINVEEEEIQLRGTRSANDFPVLCKH
jgi:hypothetical protein